MTYHPIAINHAETSENRIHSDDVAQRYGFSGALVPGVAVFGYMTHEVTKALGTDWLGRSTAEIRLIKPAYAGDRLSIEFEVTGDRQYQVDCRNAAGVLLATLAVAEPARMAEPDPRWTIRGPAENPPRVEIGWDVIDVNVPFATFTWTPTAEENLRYTDWVADDIPAYRAGVLHPHLLQHMANQVLVRRFVLPAWVHVGTDMRFRRILEVGDAIEMRTLPIEKWERKGHQFIKLYVAYLVDGSPALEAYHTAIFRLAERAA